jgi:hypothetical protein
MEPLSAENLRDFWWAPARFCLRENLRKCGFVFMTFGMRGILSRRVFLPLACVAL